MDIVANVTRVIYLLTFLAMARIAKSSTYASESTQHAGKILSAHLLDLVKLAAPAMPASFR